MSEENFDYKKHLNEMAEKIICIFPDFISEGDREYLSSIVKKLMKMCCDALCKNDSELALSKEEFELYLTFICSYTSNKGLACVYCGVPREYWEDLMQNVAFVVFELIKKYIEDNVSFDEMVLDLCETMDDTVDEVFSDNIDKLLEENIIDEKTAAMSKVFKSSSLYSSEENDNEVTLYLKANTLMLEENYEEAISYYDRLIEQEPNEEKYYYAKAICLSNLEEYEKAAEVYKKLISISDNKNFLDSVAYCYYLAKDYSNSIDYYNKYLEYLEAEAESNKDKSDYYSETGDVDLCEMYSDAASDFDEQIEKIYTMIANCYYMKDDYTNAMKNYDYVLELNPYNFEAIFAKAEWYRKQKCYNAALERYLSLPDTDIISAKIIILTNIALCYDEIKQHDMALNYYERVLEISPQNSVAIFNKGACLYELQKYDKALEFIHKSIDLGFDNIKEAYRIIIYCYMYKGMFSEAIEYCQKVLKLDPNNAEALLNEGDCYMREGKIAQAIEYTEQAIANNVETLSRAYSILGDCYSYDRDYETACEYYNKAINEILSNNDVTDNLSTSDNYKTGLAYAYYAKGNCLLECSESYDEAFMCFMRAIDYGYDREECEEKINDIKRNWG